MRLSTDGANYQYADSIDKATYIEYDQTYTLSGQYPVHLDFHCKKEYRSYFVWYYESRIDIVVSDSINTYDFDKIYFKDGDSAVIKLISDNDIELFNDYYTDTNSINLGFSSTVMFEIEMDSISDSALVWESYMGPMYADIELPPTYCCYGKTKSETYCPRGPMSSLYKASSQNMQYDGLDKITLNINYDDSTYTKTWYVTETHYAGIENQNNFLKTPDGQNYLGFDQYSNSLHIDKSIELTSDSKLLIYNTIGDQQVSIENISSNKIDLQLEMGLYFAILENPTDQFITAFMVIR